MHTQKFKSNQQTNTSLKNNTKITSCDSTVVKSKYLVKINDSFFFFFNRNTSVRTLI